MLVLASSLRNPVMWKIPSVLFSLFFANRIELASESKKNVEPANECKTRLARVGVCALTQARLGVGYEHLGPFSALCIHQVTE